MTPEKKPESVGPIMAKAPSDDTWIRVKEIYRARCGACRWESAWYEDHAEVDKVRADHRCTPEEVGG